MDNLPAATKYPFDGKEKYAMGFPLGFVTKKEVRLNAPCSFFTEL